jgi:hypothetical protein
LPEGQVEIISTIVRTERRDPVRLLDKNMSRSSDFVRICSMCKKIWNRLNKWVEIEEGLAQLKPFEADEMPRLTHGLCPDCYQIIMADLDDSRPPKKAKDSDEE